MERPDTEFAPGSLLDLLKNSTAHARRRGAIHSIETAQHFIEQDGVRFVIRTVSALTQKDKARRTQAGKPGGGARTDNPFLPYDPDVFVANISPTHVGLLNKFNVMDNHLLIVTRAFEHQETLLSRNDFGALWSCMAEFDGLGFYNGGAAAGASQPHKHLQVVPLPLANEGPAIPMQPFLETSGPTDRVHTLPGLSFAHAFTCLDEAFGARPSVAETLHRRYLDMLDHIALTAGHKHKPAPHNLLATRNWMLMVPRSQEFFGSVSINALGFAGSLFVRDAGQIDIIRRHGPMTVLRAVGYAAASPFLAEDRSRRD